ncbi:MAG: hypothetical protein EOP45_09210 [Sphingobacteriaceae bacterium]|nr:MAG: hypothetical protein EOP45_09210 [Sphingobacteriaceae bacterium]
MEEWLKVVQLQLSTDRRDRDVMLSAWIPGVLTSRLVIRLDEASYIDKVGVCSGTIWRRKFEQFATDEELIENYPGLTKDDIRICLKFETLRKFELL